jgi:hypothetical protein
MDNLALIESFGDFKDEKGNGYTYVYRQL